MPLDTGGAFSHKTIPMAINPHHLHLVLDASSPKVLTGLWQGGRWIACRTTQTQALDGLFEGAHHCLKEAGLPLEAVQGFIHCEGPGSVLGVRLSAMAIEGWKALPTWKNCPIFVYNRLALVAATLNEPEPFSLISESRQARWNVYHSASGEMSLIGDDDISTLPGKCFHFPQRKGSHQLPRELPIVDPDLEKIPDIFLTPGLLRKEDHPAVYSPDQPNYQTWTPVRHRKTAPPSAEQ